MAKRKFDVNKAAEKFRKRLEKRRKEKIGGGYLNLPDGVDVYQPEPGTATIDIVPFEVKIPIDGVAEPGELWWEFTYYMHYGIGVEENAYVCPKTFGNRCPICEHRAQLLKSGNRDQIEIAKSLRPKERQLFWVLDHADRKLKVMAMSYHTFGRQLEEEVENQLADDPTVAGFWSPDGGKCIRVRWRETSMGGGRTYVEAGRIDFIPRKHKLPKPPVALNEILDVLDYDRLRAAFFEDGGIVDDEPADWDEPGADEWNEPESEPTIETDDEFGDDWDEPENEKNDDENEELEFEL